MYEVLGLVVEERERRRSRWGDGGHPDVGAAHWRMCTQRLPLVATATLRSLVEQGKRETSGAGWLEILVEEVGEARDAAEVGASMSTLGERATWRAHLRVELVQVAAVAVAWLEDLERREAAEKGGDHG